MINYNIRNFQPEDAYAMIELQHRCVDICPDTGKFEAGMWLSPGYGNGKNIFIAKDANAQIMGYASTTSAYYSNKWEARIFWMDLRSDPEIDQDLEIKDALLRKILTRGREIKREENRKRAAARLRNVFCTRTGQHRLPKIARFHPFRIDAGYAKRIKG